MLSEPQQQAAVQVIHRIKAMSRFDIAEEQLPQEALISLCVEGNPVDVRVSSSPANHGEQVLMYLL